ncbi:MAG TPA: cytochrome D1 domain-containing protein [Hyphomicrobiaceae bacterium]
MTTEDNTMDKIMDQQPIEPRALAVPSRAQRFQDSRAAFAALLALTAATLIALGAGAARGEQPAALRDATGFVYTADEYGNSISAIDLATGRVESVPIPVSPHNVQVTADGVRLLAVGDPAEAGGHGAGMAAMAEHGSEAEGQLLVFDTLSLASGPTAAIAVGEHPAHVVADREGRRAFVTLAEADAVAVVDLVQGEVVRTVATGRYPHGQRISPDGRELYVANVEDGSVSVIDTGTLAETARIPVGQAPVQVGFTPDGARVYVSLRDEDRVAVIDTATRSVLARIDVGRGPIQVHATPDGRFVYVANQGSEAEPADTVSVIDVAAGTVVDTIRTGAGAHGVAVSGDGGYVFVTNIVDSTVSVIDAENRAVVADFAVGTGPNGVTFRAQPTSSNQADPNG